MSDSLQVTVRAFRDWEASVPIYLEAKFKDGTILVSGPFLYCAPDVLKSSGLGLSVTRFNDLVYVSKTNSPHTILSIVETKRHLVYPPSSLSGDSYYAAVDGMFDALKEGLGVSDLKLER